MEAKLTTIPPDGALPVNVTVPTAELPPVTDIGKIVTLANAAGFTVSVAVCCTPPCEAVKVTFVADPTAEVVIVNVVEVAPAATVTELGTVAELLFDDKLTTVPPGPACPASVTVPTAELPPPTELGATVRPEIVAGRSVKAAVAVLPP